MWWWWWWLTNVYKCYWQPHWRLPNNWVSMSNSNSSQLNDDIHVINNNYLVINNNNNNPFLERFDTLLRSAIQRITNSPTSSGYRPVYQLKMVVLAWDVCLRLHFPPFWLQRQHTVSARRHPVELHLFHWMLSYRLSEHFVFHQRPPSWHFAIKTTFLGSPRSTSGPSDGGN